MNKNLTLNLMEIKQQLRNSFNINNLYCDIRKVREFTRINMYDVKISLMEILYELDQNIILLVRELYYYEIGFKP